MRRELIALGALLIAGGCGGGGPRHSPPRAATPPVAQQVRAALLESLSRPALPDMTTAQRPHLPFVAISACSGPAGGAAGRYRCATTPRGRRGLRSVTVQVKRDGTWSTQPLTVTLRGRRTTAVTSVWGTGIRMPS